MYESIIHLIFPSLSDIFVFWSNLLANACTITGFIIALCKSNKKISEQGEQIKNLQLQVTEIKNNNTMENVQNKYVGLDGQQVAKLLKQLMEIEFSKGYVTYERFNYIKNLIVKIFEADSEHLELINKKIDIQQKYIDILVEISEKQGHQINLVNKKSDIISNYVLGDKDKNENKSN